LQVHPWDDVLDEVPDCFLRPLESGDSMEGRKEEIVFVSVLSSESGQVPSDDCQVVAPPDFGAVRPPLPIVGIP